MRPALALLLLVGCKTEPPEATTTRVVLPQVAEGTLFAVVDLAEEVLPVDRYGVMGDATRLGGTLEIEAVRPHVLTFRPGSFNGIVGPEPIFARPELRDGMDNVRLPQPESVFAVEGGELIAIDTPESTSDLRIPCDGSRAATRPSVDSDPSPRCVVQAGGVAITCTTIASAPTVRMMQSGGRVIGVRLTQEGCRVEIECVDQQDCASGFPLRAVLPPSGAASGEAALLELTSVVDPSMRCSRGSGDETSFVCPDADYTLLPR